jgi:hypothetical protein
MYMYNTATFLCSSSVLYQQSNGAASDLRKVGVRISRESHGGVIAQGLSQSFESIGHLAHWNMSYSRRINDIIRLNPSTLNSG